MTLRMDRGHTYLTGVVATAVVLMFLWPQALFGGAWTDLSGIDCVLDVAATDDVIWANTVGGLVLWDRQTKTWEKYPVSYGVHAVAVAPDGAVWITSSHELIRDDGADTLVFTDDDVDVSGGIVDIAFGSGGVVWIVNQWGYAAYYDGSAWTPVDEDDGLPLYIRNVAVQPDGTAWFSTRLDGVFRYSDGVVSHVPEITGYGRGMTADRDGRVWIGSDAGLTVVDGDSVMTRDTGGITALATSPGGSVTAAAGSQVYMFDGLSPSGSFTVEGDGIINALTYGEDGGLWLGTSRWLGCLKDGAWEYYTGGSGLSSNVISAMEAARDGSVWFGHTSSRDGIDRYNGGGWEFVPSGGGQVNSVVTAIYEHTDGSVWFGPFLCRYAGGEWTSYKDVVVDSAFPVLSFASSPDGALWVGADITVLWERPLDPALDTLWRYYNGEWTGYCMDDGVVASPVLALAVDGANTLWVGTGYGLCCFDGGTWTTVTAADGMLGECIMCLRTDGGGDMWACTDAGLHRRTGPRWERYVASDGTSPVNPHVIVFDSAGGLWMGTHDGLLYDDGASLRRFTMSDGLANDDIETLDMAPDGSLWVGTSRGVSRYVHGNGTLVEEPPPSAPDIISNYPNPFNPATAITYSLPADGMVRLTVHDALGRTVATLVDERQTFGRHTVRFDARDLASGVYFCRLNAGRLTATRKMLLLK